MKFYLMSIFLSLNASFSLNSTSKVLIKPYSKQALLFEVINFQPAEGHHFELNAPQTCGGGELIFSEKEEIKCQVLKLGNAKFELNVCDDKKTFCKPIHFEIAVKEGPKGHKKAPLKPKLVEMKEHIHQELLPGFQTLKLKDLEQQALKLKKPVLIMISTDWCPPCNQSKEYFLSLPEFHELTKGWLKVYVDGDSEDSNDFDRKFKFLEYPTFILTHSNLEEVARFREEFAMDEFKKWLARSRPYITAGYEKTKQEVLLRRKKDLGQKFKDFLMLRNKNSVANDFHYVLENALASRDEEFLSKVMWEEVPKDLRSLWLSMTSSMKALESLQPENRNKEGLKVAGLTSSYYTYLKELCEANDPVCDDEINSFEKRKNLIISRANRSKIENLMALADDFASQTYFFKVLGNRKRQIQSAKKCVDAFEKLIPFSNLKTPRYALQGVVVCARDYNLDLAEKVYLDLIKKFPEDSTFLVRYALFLKNERKDLPKAKVWALRALENSYDFNWFSSASVKIQIDQALGHKKDAKDTIQEAYNRVGLEENKAHDSRNQRVLSRIRQLERNL